VRGSGTLCDLPADAMEDFKSLGQVRMCRPHQLIYSEGNPCDGLYLVCHGAVKLYHSDRFGRDHILEIAGPGAVLGEFPGNGNGGMSVSAETLTEAQLSYLPRSGLVKFVECHPTTAVRLIEAFSRELAAARRKVRDLALKSGESRLAALILQLVRADRAGNGTTTTLSYRRRELAEMIGVSTETAIRLLAKLKAKGAVEAERRDLRVIDMDKLTRIAEHDEA
jgi:CRP/FNR family transcriptional regulator